MFFYKINKFLQYQGLIPDKCYPSSWIYKVSFYSTTSLG